MKVDRPKKHHYIARAVLRHFSIRNEGRQVHVFDKQEQRSYVSSINDAAAENYFYSVELGDDRVILESVFDDIDSLGAAVLEKLHRSRSLGALSRDEKTLLGITAAAQLLRVKMRRTDLIQLSRQLIELLKKYGGDPEVARDEQPLTDNQARISAILYPARLPTFAQPFANKDLLLIAPTGKSFMIGDNPVVRFNSFPYGDLGLSSPGIEIYLPIGSDLTIGFYCPTIRRHLEQLEAFGEPKFQAWLDGLRSGEPIHYTPDQVDHLNELQVRSASRYLFSSDGDFSLAQAVLALAPNLARVETMLEMGWEGYTHREAMPPGTFVVAFGKSNHYMIPEEIVERGDPDECEWRFISSVPAMVVAAVRDGPFSEVTLYVDKHMTRMIRDAIFILEADGTVCARHRDESLHRMGRAIKNRRHSD